MRKDRRARERIKKDKLARKMKIYNRYGIYNMDVSAFMQRFHSSENINEVFSCVSDSLLRARIIRDCIMF